MLKLLAVELGSRRLAIGTVVEFWELAQEYWARGGQLIPMKRFKALGLPECLLEEDLGLAEIQGDEIYARGAREHFEWILTQQEKSRLGGIASAKSRSNKNKGLVQPEANQGSTNPQPLQPPVPVPGPVPEEGREEGPAAPALPGLTPPGEDPQPPKKSKKPRASISHEPIPALLEVREELGGKVGAPTQEAWVKAYGADFTIQRIRKAHLWNAKRNFVKKDLARFYGTWLQGDFDKLTPDQQNEARGIRKLHPSFTHGVVD